MTKWPKWVRIYTLNNWKDTTVQQKSWVFAILIKLSVLGMEFICFLIRIDYFPWMWCSRSLESNLHSVQSSLPDKYWTPLITQLYYLYDFFNMNVRTEQNTSRRLKAHLRLWMCPSPPGELLNPTMLDINRFNKEETNNDTTFEYQTCSNSYHFLLWMTIMTNYCYVCAREGSRPPTKFYFSETFPETASVPVDYKCLFSATSVYF